MSDKDTYYMDPTIHHHYEALLLDYAAGNLGPAQNLLLAAYLTLSPAARRFVQECEEIGGAIISGHCPPTDLSPDILDRVLEQIEGNHIYPDAENPVLTGCSIACCAAIPQSIARLFPPQDHLIWQRAAGGMEWVECTISDDTATMRMIRTDPGFAMSPLTHHGPQIALVLDGAMGHGQDRYVRGDLFIIGEGEGEENNHHHIADQAEGCLYFSVQTSHPVRRKAGLFARLFQRG